MNIEDFEFYSFRGGRKMRYYFIYKKDTEDMIEGEVHISFGSHGGETYPYVDFLEFENEDEVSEELEDELSLFIEKHIDKVIEAPILK